MATTTMLPDTCPICSRDFTAEAATSIPGHIAAHLAIYFIRTQFGKTVDEGSLDW